MTPEPNVVNKSPKDLLQGKEDLLPKDIITYIQTPDINLHLNKPKLKPELDKTLIFILTTNDNVKRAVQSIKALRILEGMNFITSEQRKLDIGLIYGDDEKINQKIEDLWLEIKDEVDRLIRTAY